VAAADPRGRSSHGATRAFERLLFIADAAVADADELPPVVRAVIDGAADVYVITPTLPGRLAWLADDVDGFRHVADERLDTVLEHMRSIGAHTSGRAGRGSLSLVIGDAVAEFEPDHVLIALRSAEHANWQERRLIEYVEHEFGLPVTTFAVDPRGHTLGADGPLLLCYDGSIEARGAIERAGALFPGAHALAVTAWQGPKVGGLSWDGVTPTTNRLVETIHSAAERARRLAEEGARIAENAGLAAEPAAVEATGRVWRTILEVADRQDAAAIVMGSRGLGGVHARVAGSVSSAVVHHSARPALVVPALSPARIG
jgi:nucleotide-binding universal stress UspA family protein